MGGFLLFGRVVVPVTPLLLVLAELGLSGLLASRPAIQALAAAIAAVAVALTPYPFQGEGWVMGIVNEWRFYPPWKVAAMQGQGLTLRRYFAGLPVRLAFLGGEARMVYYARPAVAIECQTGLTDRVIARQVLAERGRVGHEKQASLDYLLDRRAAHFIFHPTAQADLSLDKAIPMELVNLGGVSGLVLTWDSALMDSLRGRGARFEDFPTRLDRLLTEVPAASDSQVRVAYDALARFYFRHVSDPRRERPFLDRLESQAMRTTQLQR